MNETNWSTTLSINVTEKDIRALKSAKELESRREKNGYRWVRVDGRTSVFVQCDKDGNPTEKGTHQIESVRKLL